MIEFQIWKSIGALTNVQKMLIFYKEEQARIKLLLSENCLNQKNVKITKWELAFKGFASTYYFEILISFNPELPPRDAESANKVKLIDLLSKLNSVKKDRKWR